MLIPSDEVWSEFVAGIQAVRRGPDADAATVHQIRTSASRLRAWLELGGHGALRDDLRWVRRRAAPLRDADVALARRVPEPLASWLAAERPVRRRDFLRTLRHPRFAGLARAMPLVPALHRSAAPTVLKALERRVRRRGAAVGDTAPVEILHRLRRAIRRLRHAREWLDRDCDDLRATLDALGALNDTASLLHLADNCPGRGELAEFRDELRVRMERERAAAVAAWSETRSEWRSG